MKGLKKIISTGALALGLYTGQASADLLKWGNISENYSENGIGGGTATIYHDYFGQTNIDSGDVVMDNLISPNNQFFVTYDEVDNQKLEIDRRNWDDGIGATYKSTLSFENRLDTSISDIENNISFLNLEIGRDFYGTPHPNNPGVTGYNYEVWLNSSFTKNLDDSVITGESDGNGYTLFDSGSVVEGMSSANWLTSLPGTFDHANGDNYGYVKWTAVPEPLSVGLFGIGALLSIGAGRLRRTFS